jgi:hypothetical protein
MMGGTGFRDKFRSIASNLIVFSLVLGGISLFTGDEVLAQDDLILRIGSQDEPKTRNILAAVDVWTHNVLDPVYDTVNCWGLTITVMEHSRIWNTVSSRALWEDPLR